jgi:DNA invertase Pin-like site-specific DNA recombinase
VEEFKALPTGVGTPALGFDSVIEDATSVEFFAGSPSPRKMLAAEYVRMSTEHQQYSTENQRIAIRDYAARRGMEIARTYEDAGKSGLNINRRDGLQRLLEDVQHGRADFQAILVYDVSRWGRFQDADESAYYEYLCRRSKIEVHYCAEQFENDGSPASTIVKGLKRAMAGEYSRELSAKVFVGQCRLVEMGFNQGSKGGFGLRRILIDASGAVKATLNRGERKSIHTDRVVLRPGPPEEVATVVRMYQMYLHEKKTKQQIVQILNDEGIVTDTGRPWTQPTVHTVLTNEKYIGNNVYNRTSFKLKKTRMRNPPEMWVRYDAAFDPVVPPDLFAGVQELMRSRYERRTDAELLRDLRALLERKQYLNRTLIDQAEGVASAQVYLKRFNSLANAYRLVGYTPAKDLTHFEKAQALRRLGERLLTGIAAKIQEQGGSVGADVGGALILNREFTVSVQVIQCRPNGFGSFRWRAKLGRASFQADVLLAVRMDADNNRPLDYYLLPIHAIKLKRLLLREDNGLAIDTFRFDSLNFLLGMGQRTKLMEIL